MSQALRPPRLFRHRARHTAAHSLLVRISFCRFPFRPLRTLRSSRHWLHSLVSCVTGPRCWDHIALLLLVPYLAGRRYR